MRWQEIASRRWPGGLAGGFATLGIGILGGALFWKIGIPLSWLLGALVFVGVLGGIGLPLALPESWRSWIMVAIGTMLGTSFDASTPAALLAWWPSILIMLVVTALFTALTQAAIRHWSDMDNTSAFLAAMPGGLALAAALSEENGGDTARIALFHMVRLLFILILAPAVIRLGVGADTFDDSFNLPRQHAGLGSWLILAAISITGYMIALRCRFSGAQLLVPMLISGVAHGGGFVDTDLPGAAVIVAQVVIGANIGLRLCKSARGTMLADVRLAAGIGICLTLASLAIAVLAAALLGEPTLPLLLSYLPGGAPEMGVVALAIGADPAMVAVHHALRIVAILLVAPFVIAAMRRPG